MEGLIFSHFMYGYCKFQDYCPKQHINVICPDDKDCDNNGCVKHHPKTCKYFEKNRKCVFLFPTKVTNYVKLAYWSTIIAMVGRPLVLFQEPVSHL